MDTSHVDLPGNTRRLGHGARRLGPADPDQIVVIIVVVRGKQELPEPGPNTAPLSIAEIERDFGANPEDIHQVFTALGKFGLIVTASSAGARTIELLGTVDHVQNAFAVELGEYETAKQGRYRGREGGIRIPAELEGIVEAVLGLDERQVARRRPVSVRGAPDTSGTVGPQTPADLEARYSFPAGTAANQKIGILEFGGGYFESDLEMYCNQIARRSQPNVTVVSVGLTSLTLQQIEASRNQQKRDNDLDASGEVNMDIQVIAGLCPDAQILVYFAPFSQKGWVNILQKAIHDLNGPGVISLSWGIPEDSGDLSPAAITAINNMLKTAAVAGVTICVSSGDDGAGDAVNDGKAHCDFPASSPYVLAVGGTSFPDGGEDVGWWDSPGARTGNGGGSSGGGRSTVFPTPTWQNVNVVSVRTGQAAGRCIPDVSALSADPLYNLVFQGQVSPNGGTSASAPLWASLIARIAGNFPAGKTVGFLTPKLYQPGPNGNPLGSTATTDVASGHNDVLAFSQANFVAVKGYKASVGYDAVTGWGVPNGTALLNALMTLSYVIEEYHDAPETPLRLYIAYEGYLGVEQLSQVLSSLDRLYTTLVATLYPDAPSPLPLEAKMRISSCRTGESILIQLVGAVNQIWNTGGPLVHITGGLGVIGTMGKLVSGVAKDIAVFRRTWYAGTKIKNKAEMVIIPKVKARAKADKPQKKPAKLAREAETPQQSAREAVVRQSISDSLNELPDERKRAISDATLEFFSILEDAPNIWKASVNDVDVEVIQINSQTNR